MYLCGSPKPNSLSHIHTNHTISTWWTFFSCSFERITTNNIKFSLHLLVILIYPDTLSSLMLLCRKLLIFLKQENERSASQLPTGRVHAIFSKIAMFVNTSQSACWRHCFRLTAVTLSFLCQNLCHCFSSVLSVVGCGRSLSQNKSPLTRPKKYCCFRKHGQKIGSVSRFFSFLFYNGAYKYTKLLHTFLSLLSSSYIVLWHVLL